MKIETTYDIGDTVFYMFNNKIICREVSAITIYIDGLDSVKIAYRIPGLERSFYAEDLFNTREELIDTL